ncbi:ATP-binding protein [Phormidium yuhuli AB48]|uniref:ATP-binding protein n=1 Tax=Phormidium yuhuli AB48 TaxID=2940671 RepID=A0ABY5APH7_9CYAN|nr:ATP-binding protein [Phormidium yuhuli]USR90681.1 ATP-binding protein [Phormidium yuhuli AB48]
MLGPIPPEMALKSSPTKESVLELFGRQAQFQEITHTLANGKDLLIAGVPGSGRRTLVRRAALEVGAKVIEVDCIRATDGRRFVQLLCEGISQGVQSQRAIAFLRDWAGQEGQRWFEFNETSARKLSLQREPALTEDHLWQAYQQLLQFPQQLAIAVERQVILIFLGFPHIRAWDRTGQWETCLQEAIARHTTANYVLVTTLAESRNRLDEPSGLMTVCLTPLADDVVAAWAQLVLHQVGLSFDPRSSALDLFLNAVQGHIGDASMLVRRLRQRRWHQGRLDEAAIQETLEDLLADLSNIFESILVLLPASQLQLLESLALDPTDKPQSRDYIQKHHLSRGGSLQGAIAALQHKGLIYGPDLGYRLALPLFALWIRQRLR